MKPSLSRIADRRLLVLVIGLCTLAGLVPLAVSVILSFSPINATNEFGFGSLEGYSALLAGGRVDEFVHILKRSIVVSLVALAFALPATYWVTKLRPRLRVLIVVLVVAPWLVSDMLRAFGWQLLLSPSGPISGVWEFITQSGPLEGLRYNDTAVILGLVSALLPASVLSVFAAVPDRSRNEWRAANELCRPSQVFVLMMFGRAKFGVLLAGVAVFVLSAFSSAEALFLGGPTQTSIKTITASLVNEGVPAMLAFSTVLIAFVYGLLAAVLMVYFVLPRIRRRTKKAGESFLVASSKYKALSTFVQQCTEGLWRFSDTIVQFLPSFAGMTVLVVCWLPIVSVGIEAFRLPTVNGMVWTLENFEAMFASAQLRHAFLNSFGVAAAVSVLTVTLAFVLSLAVWDREIKPIVLTIIAAFFFLSGDAYSIGLIQLLGLFGIKQGGWVQVIVAHSIWALPFAAGTLFLANQRISRNVLYSGLECEGRPLAAIFQVVGRINFGRVVGVAVLAATLSINEYVRASYLGGSLITISNEVHGRLTAGLLPQNRGMFAAEFLVIAFSILAVYLVARGRWSVRSAESD